ncbi:MAG: tRNA uridine-5-carboxymethylaminomethyl(34) synthesis GTPase MnmE [Clostridia bacterium]|jgi:tRNA modification GTPase|nr:tRNA uridine-5-carboxymethylaminomethyl(34) synthesis GTPase MnmE [Clostridia bacterium]MCI2015065.1 tRNA uridine-5-carboxymethylaminomethyl(34) synthesis GTPase MnmE [Clostridia bacterium]
MKSYLDDIIAAISTPAGTGGIGIVRMSGDGCIDVADKIFESKTGIRLSDKKSHTITYGKIKAEDGSVIDEVLVSMMKKPNTYTCEDVVEINCHGGFVSTSKVLERVLNAGARLAEGGEFTKRAFLNGRIDLSQAEAVIDIINSKTDMGRQSAVNQLEGRLGRKVKEMRSKLLDAISTIEAAIDYPEHDIEEETYAVLKEKSQSVLSEIEKLLETADMGKIVREGIKTVILGKPNVGKSSLLNFLLDEERAIVTDVPGTTRDTVEEFVNIAGVPVNIADTAGIRHTDDIVEKMGVERSFESAKMADLILLILDTSREIDDDDRKLLDFVKDKKCLILLNKTDLEPKFTADDLKIDKKNVIEMSVRENIGTQELVERLKNMFFGGDIEIKNGLIISNSRHKNALYEATQSLKRAINTIDSGMPEDFVSMDLSQAVENLGEITGESMQEDLLNRIFERFCVGK